MRAYSGVPHPLVDGWSSTIEAHPARQAVAFHYHDVDEWLEVLRGEITFFPLRGDGCRVAVGGALRIPRGEVHRADIGDDGVEYRMHLPVAIPADFGKRLTADEIALLQSNLEWPVQEDTGGDEAAAFFEDALSASLAFARANGTVVDKRGFLKDGFTLRDRSAPGTVRVLNQKKDFLLISILVTTGTGGTAPQSSANLRVLVNEGGTWRCRMWMNVPEAAGPAGWL